MGVDTGPGTLFPQCQALMHAEAMLLVDDHQHQVMEGHRLLKHGMGADDEADLAIADGGQLLFPCLALLLAGQPADTDAELV